MSKTNEAVLASLDRLIQVLTEKPNVSMGDLTLGVVTAARTKLDNRDKLAEEGRANLGRLIDEADDARGEGEQIYTRGLSGIRAAFGPDSPEYAQAGGTRASERKPRKKKPGGSDTSNK